jgi:hypothetical protein
VQSATKQAGHRVRAQLPEDVLHLKSYLKTFIKRHHDAVEPLLIIMEDPLGSDSSEFEARMIEGEGGWLLNVFSWTPNNPESANRKPVIVIPGWTSVVDGWIPLLTDWVQYRPVHYIETREKNFTKSPDGHKERSSDFSIPNHSLDMNAVVRNLGLNPADCDWFASSLGSTSVIEGIKKGHLEVNSAFLLAPNAEFKFPWWMALMTSMPWWFYPPMMRLIAIPYMKWKVKEPGQKKRYTRTMKNADMRRLKLSTKANRAYEIWPDLETVTASIAICVAESDALHAHDDALKIGEILPNGKIIEVPSNQFAHEAAVRPIIEEWIQTVESARN